MRGFGSLLRSPALKVPGFAPEQVRFLTFGRGLDNTRMRTELGFEPSYTTEEAFDDFAASLKPGPLARHHPVVVLEEALAGARDGSKETHGG
jgi:UDP-glucose 4-epimerase